MKKTSRAIFFATAGSVALTACTTTGGGRLANGAPVSACDSRQSTAGATIGGALLGAAVGALVDGGRGAVRGAVVGGAAGVIWGSYLDAEACRRETQAAAFGFRIQQSEKIDWSAPAQQASTAPKVTVLTAPEEVFTSGSSTLTVKGREYFLALAKDFTGRAPTPSELEGMKPEDQETLRAKFVQRRSMPLLLVGHTDDVGSDVANQKLSEARAKAVGEVMRESGVEPDRIYYWGAGESRPLADNRSAEGQAKNRRVNVMEFASVSDIEAFVQQDKPRTEFQQDQENKSRIPQVAQPKADAKAPAAGTEPVQATEAKQTPSSAIYPKAVPTSGTKPTAPSPSEVKPLPDTTTKDGQTPELHKPNPKPERTYRPASFDLGGKLLDFTDRTIVDKIGRQPVKTSWLISTAIANEFVTPSCGEDRPNTSGTIRRLDNDKPLGMKVLDLWPGMEDVAWAAVVNGHYVALKGIAVGSDGSSIPRNPTVQIYQNWAAVKDKRAAQPDFTYATSAKAVPGANGLLYRVFVTDANASISCIDLFVAKTGAASGSGVIVQERERGIFAASYNPKKP